MEEEERSPAAGDDTIPREDPLLASWGWNDGYILIVRVVAGSQRQRQG